MSLAAFRAPDLGNAIPADAYDLLPALRWKRTDFQIFPILRFHYDVIRTVKLDLAASRAAVDLGLQGSRHNIGPISGKETGLSELDLLPLQKSHFPATGTLDRSHWAASMAWMTPLTPSVFTVSIRPLS